MGRKTRAFLSGLICAAMSVTAFVQSVSAETLLKNEKLEEATAAEIMADMGIGWNLGNSLDATDGGYSNESEISWSNPKTTQELISKVKELGFNTVRVPVSWGNHSAQTTYKISAAWLQRVKEVVDYCYNEDMYVIVNIHHDCLKQLKANSKGYTPSSAYYDQSEAFVDSIWSQVADYFKDYDYHLIFETLNEPRLIGDVNEWWFTSSNIQPNVKDSINCINKLNQSAVDVIRAAGGYNEKRLIMCPGYDASVDGATNSMFKLPTDISGNKNRLVVSVHGYSPYDFAMGSVRTYNTTQQRNLKNWTMDPIKTKYIDKGIPVVMGEFSATAAKDLEERKKWAEDYAGQASAMNMPIILWDNNAFNKQTDNGQMNSECHGYINRSDNTVSAEQQAVLDILIAPYKELETKRKAEMTVYTDIEVNCTVSGLTEDNKSLAGIKTAEIYNADKTVSMNFNLNTGNVFSVPDVADGEYTVVLNADNCVSKTTTFTIKDGKQVAPVNETINLLGDINGDGKLNSLDIILIKRHIIMRSLNEYQQACADVDGKNGVNSLDIIRIKRAMIKYQPLWK